MTSPTDKLLDHFNRLAGTEGKFTCVSDEGVEPRFHVATYFGFPDDAALTGFTTGLSHFHQPDGSHKELTISMLDTNDAWALACGFIAFQLRGRCPFNCGETLNFKVLRGALRTPRLADCCSLPTFHPWRWRRSGYPEALAAPLPGPRRIR